MKFYLDIFDNDDVAPLKVAPTTKGTEIQMNNATQTAAATRPISRRSTSPVNLDPTTPRSRCEIVSLAQYQQHAAQWGKKYILESGIRSPLMPTAVNLNKATPLRRCTAEPEDTQTVGSKAKCDIVASFSLRDNHTLVAVTLWDNKVAWGDTQNSYCINTLCLKKLMDTITLVYEEKKTQFMIVNSTQNFTNKALLTQIFKQIPEPKIHTQLQEIMGRN